ncbi:Tectonic-1 [Boothiomyces macroporosus]|uniref:Tectonic-1 n=1 Tax=Boothiomyces macroporosus TaxID=261099 RepID=A0AAD5Y5P0_9FUNG|nr:Tectonic-1 [Boothiomyces macroporosus]
MRNIFLLSVASTIVANNRAKRNQNGTNTPASTLESAGNFTGNATAIGQSQTTQAGLQPTPATSIASTTDANTVSSSTVSPTVIFANNQIARSDFNHSVGISWSNVITSQPLTNWNRDISVCSCDLTFNQCDPNCCCDPDCTANGEQSAYFTTCQTTTQTTLPYCSSYLSKVTWADGVKIKTIPALGGGLCLMYVNSAVKGEYFTDVGSFTDDTSFTAQYEQGLYLTSKTTYDIAVNISVSPYKDPTSSATVTTSTNFMCIDPNTNVATSSCPSLPTSPTPVLSGTTCSNTVVEVALVFSYKIVSSVLTLTSLDITFVLDSRTMSNSIEQTFSVEYQLEGTVNVYAKSGNPGYIYGLPVLSGLEVSQGSSNAISFNTDPQFGITLVKDTLSSGTIGCTSSTSDYGNRLPVTFGENTISGCTLWLTRDDLLNNCDSLRSRIYNLQTLTAQNIDSIGKFGNASTTNVYDWIKIINNPPSALTGTTSSPGTGVGICSNLLTSFNVEFLYSSYGSTSDPQQAIVGARYSYTSGTFEWTCESVQDCVDPNIYVSGSESQSNIGTVKKPFQLSSTVSFVQVSTLTLQLYVPPPPKIYAELPDDIWYPFSIPT